jgi:hypothetical protein
MPIVRPMIVEMPSGRDNSDRKRVAAEDRSP